MVNSKSINIIIGLCLISFLSMYLYFPDKRTFDTNKNELFFEENQKANLFEMKDSTIPEELYFLIIDDSNIKIYTYGENGPDEKLYTFDMHSYKIVNGETYLILHTKDELKEIHIYNEEIRAVRKLLEI